MADATDREETVAEELADYEEDCERDYDKGCRPLREPVLQGFLPDFALKPELNSAIRDVKFEHASEGAPPPQKQRHVLHWHRCSCRVSVPRCVNHA